LHQLSKALLGSQADRLERMGSVLCEYPAFKIMPVNADDSDTYFFNIVYSVAVVFRCKSFKINFSEK
jgi:hypothetical protein